MTRSYKIALATHLYRQQAKWLIWIAAVFMLLRIKMPNKVNHEMLLFNFVADFRETRDFHDHFWWLIFVIWFKLKSRFQCRLLNRPVDIISTGCEYLNCTRDSQFSSLEHYTNTSNTNNVAFRVMFAGWLTDDDGEVGRSMSIHYKCILWRDGWCKNPKAMKLFRQVGREKKNWPK